MNGQEWWDHYRLDVHEGGQDGREHVEIKILQFEQMRLKYASLPEVTLSAVTETGQPESSIQVPKQQSYTGRNPVIPSALADTPCSSLGVEGLLGKLNSILNTSYTMEMRSLSSLLDSYIMEDYDVGTIYGHLRQFWYLDLTDIKATLRTCEAWDRHMRQNVLVNDKIISNLLPPRRVWDLFSNRVVPWWVVRQYPLPISHAWMKEEDRMDVHTPINGCEWPVPMPKDANLDLIRIEMLNEGAEYAWLDVLCLRQVGGRREDLRVEEWKVDVPTIGRVYTMSHRGLVCYLSGLGRPFSLKENDLKSDTCWFRRAWTLQEIRQDMVIGGDTGDDRFMEKEMRTRVENRLSLLGKDVGVGVGVGGLGMPVFIALSEMQKRVSTNPVDRVAGFSYLLSTDDIPAYYAAQSEEEAWNALVDKLNMTYRGHLFFLYPKPGNGNKLWRPSWMQAMTEVLPPPHSSGRDSGWMGYVQRTKKKDADWCDGPCIESGYVRGLSQGSLEGTFRQGELIVKGNRGTKHTFKIVADHQCPVPEGSYALTDFPRAMLGHRGKTSGEDVQEGIGVPDSQQEGCKETAQTGSYYKY
ncbi:hypothetical protein ARMSODRAFT_1010061 [Armillaria solidipes]|uniref:Heterokaryon incompatibility domain-containing protein n=1 Tax=Armillaria solidipes TaxID=1076256 RepID=A0A2H3APG6_9AGAR|nr:hypothetical protein ARMSODRAFT_1010061 [Armillaria solidipes]